METINIDIASPTCTSIENSVSESEVRKQPVKRCTKRCLNTIFNILAVVSIIGFFVASFTLYGICTNSDCTPEMHSASFVMFVFSIAIVGSAFTVGFCACTLGECH